MNEILNAYGTYCGLVLGGIMTVIIPIVILFHTVRLMVVLFTLSPVKNWFRNWKPIS